MLPGASPSPSPALNERWAGLGRAGTVTVDFVELWRVELPFSDPVATARGVHRRRPLALVRVVGGTGATGPVEGWGECAALADTTFDDEDVDRSLGILGHELVPALFEQRTSGRRGLRGPTDLDSIRDVAPDSPLAFAALEMAVADTHLRAERRSLAALLGVEGRSVEPGAVVGLADSVEQLLDRVGSLVGQGYSRVKVKIAPGWDLEPISALVGAFPHLRLQVDANAAYRSGDGPGEDTGGHLAGLDRFGLLCIEQPFDPADLGAHAYLAARLSTPICLDESLDSPSRVEEALALGACSVVCVKPGRLGGLGAALSVIEGCRRSGVPAWMGGMFESGYARGVNTTLGALDGMSWPGDLSSSRSYLGDDLVPDPPAANPARRTRSDGSHTPPLRPVSRGPGMGPAPDPEALARLGTLHQVIRGR